jgi:hypothetical protein
MALTANYIPRYKGDVGGHLQVQNSAIVDDGAAIALGRNTDITGDLDVSSTIKGAAGMTLAGTIVGVTTAITGTKNNALTISVPNQTADAAGVGIAITADAGAVGARNGGSITLTPGAKSGGGADGSVVINGAWTAAGKTCADLGTVTTCNIDGGAIDGAIIGANTAAAVTGTTLTANTSISSAGDITMTSANKGIILKRGANGRCGSFTANETTPVTVSNTAFAITDTVIISLQAVGGTVGALPHLVTVTAATGFDVVASAGDTSTYNYALISNAA